MKKKKTISVKAEVLRILRDQYEALRPDPLRLQPTIRTDRTITGQLFYAANRLKAYALGNEAYENDTTGAIVDTAVRMAVGIHGGKPFFLGDDAPVQQARWDSWAHTCGFAEGEHWNELLQQILRAVKIHGDCLVLVDPDLTAGKLRIWDADQIVSLEAGDFHAWGAMHGLPTVGTESDPIYRQVEGVVTDPWGRVAGYFVTSKRNRYAVKLEDATFLPASLCRRVSAHTRISQYRGEPAILPLLDLSNDTRQLIKAEVAAARNHSETSILLEEPSAGDDVSAVLSAVSDGGTIAPEVAEASGLAADDLSGQIAALIGSQKEDLTAIQGKSAIGRVRQGTQVHTLDNANRPSQPIQQWLDKIADLNGQRLGVLSCLSRGRAETSYSSGQIELAISWAKFEEDQKMLERLVVDYAVGVICPGARYMVSWPKAFEIDPQKAEATYDARLKSGRTTFQELMGPDWRKQVDSMAEFVAYCKEKGVEPATFSWLGETSAGNAKETPIETATEEGPTL